MAGGVGVAGFGGGFGKGLASILLHNREVKREEEQRAETRRLQGHMAALPIYLQHAQETGDYSVVEEVLGQIEPDLVKKFKKEGSPFQALGPLLSNPELIGKVSVPTGVTSPELEQEPKEPLIPTRVAGAAPPEPPKTFLGMPVLTPEQRLERADEASDPAVKMRLAQRLAKRTGMPLEEALDRFGLREFTGTSTPYQSVAGEMPDGSPAFGVFDRKTGQYHDPATDAPLQGFRPRTTTASVSLGQWAEKAAGELGYKTAAAARAAGPEAMKAVNERAAQLQAEAEGTKTGARMEAAAKGPLSTQQKFQALTDLQNAWRKAEWPRREMERQYQIMETGLKRFNQGDKIGGSQAVLVTFQKILDPTSVVRESEYARSAQGLGLMQRIEGAIQRLREGGAGVPPEELAGMVQTAKEFLDGMAGWNDIERERITSTAKDFGLNPERVFGVAAAADQKERDSKPAVPLPSGIEMSNGRLVVKPKPK